LSGAPGKRLIDSTLALSNTRESSTYPILLKKPFKGRTSWSTIRPAQEALLMSTSLCIAMVNQPEDKVVQTPLRSGREKPKEELASVKD
jgi:hypothetical protein